MDISTPRNLQVWQNRYNKNSPLYLATGDSWFNYPGENSSIIFPYSLTTFLSNKIDICDYSLFGSTTDRIIKPDNIKFIKDRLSYILHTKIDNNIVKGFLISIGGNDMINNIGDYVDSNGIINDKFNDILMKIEKNITFFVNEMKKDLNKDIKYVFHSYDYININMIGEGFNSWFTKIKPWIYPNFEKKGITDKKFIFTCMKIIIDKFYLLLKKIESNNENVVIIDLRKRLIDLKYWENEIHPSKEGFKILSDYYYTQLMGEIKC